MESGEPREVGFWVGRRRWPDAAEDAAQESWWGARAAATGFGKVEGDHDLDESNCSGVLGLLCYLTWEMESQGSEK